MMRTRKFNPAATGQGGLLGGFQDDIVSGLLGMGNQASSNWEEWMQDPVRNIRESLTDWPAIDTDAMAARGITEDDFLNALDSVAPGAGMLGRTVFHGSPHKWDSVDMSKIGTGEGAQAYGHGFYTAGNPDVAKQYQKALETSQIEVNGTQIPNTSGGHISRDGLRAALAKSTGASVDDADKLIRFVDDPDDISKMGALSRMDKAIDMYANSGYQDAADEVARLKPYMDKIESMSEARTGHLYELDLPDSTIDKMLDWDAPLSEQSAGVLSALDKGGIGMPPRPKGVSVRKEAANDYALVAPNGGYMPNQYTTRKEAEAVAKRINDAKYATPKHLGEDVHDELVEAYRKAGATNPQKMAAKELESLGIPGIRYYDGASRAAGQGSRNYVVFDENDITALTRNGEKLGLLGM